MQTHEPFQTTHCGAGHKDALAGYETVQSAEHGSGLQVLCLEVERQLNRHYRRLLAFFHGAFSDRQNYPLNAEQAVMLFCISNGLRDTAQLYRTIEPLSSQTVIMLASLIAQGYVVSAAESSDDLTVLRLTAKGQAVADGLFELYDYVFLDGAGRDVPDAARLASMHNSLWRLQRFSLIKANAV